MLHIRNIYMLYLQTTLHLTLTAEVHTTHVKAETCVIYSALHEDVWGSGGPVSHILTLSTTYGWRRALTSAAVSIRIGGGVVWMGLIARSFRAYEPLKTENKGLAFLQNISVSYIVRYTDSIA